MMPAGWPSVSLLYQDFSVGYHACLEATTSWNAEVAQGFETPSTLQFPARGNSAGHSLAGTEQRHVQQETPSPLV